MRRRQVANAELMTLEVLRRADIHADVGAFSCVLTAVTPYSWPRGDL